MLIVLNDMKYAQIGEFSTAWKEIPMKNMACALCFGGDNFLEMEILDNAKQEHTKRVTLVPKEI